VLRDCFSKKKCNIAECSVHHHPLLHGAPKFSVSFQGKQDKEEQSKSSIPKSDIQKKAVGAHTVKDDTITLLLITGTVIIEANGIRINSV